MYVNVNSYSYFYVGSDKVSGSNSSNANTPDDGRNSAEPILGGLGSGVGECHGEEEDTEPPAIVVYLVEPFTFGSDNPELQRLACLGLLRCFNTVQANLPDNVRANITLQVRLLYYFFHHHVILFFYILYLL